MDYQALQSLSPVTAECVVAASNQYLVPPLVILSILKVEGGKVGAVSHNTNGTMDIGPMQINSIHLPSLAQYGIAFENLKNNGCLNISIGAYLIKKAEIEISKNKIILSPKDYWKSVGNYHSKTPEKNAIYVKKVAEAAAKMPKEWKEFDCRKYNACSISLTHEIAKKDVSYQTNLGSPQTNENKVNSVQILASYKR